MPNDAKQKCYVSSLNRYLYIASLHSEVQSLTETQRYFDIGAVEVGK